MNCLHPVRIRNPYTYEYMFVPCGKCEGCMITRANSLSRRISNELSKHSYNLFFTLTYDNLHLPFIQKDKFGNIDCICNVCQVHQFSYMVDGVQKHDKCVSSSKVMLDYSFDELPPFQPFNHDLSNICGVLYKPHIQKFIRSIRDSLRNYYGKTIKLIYFVVGEYGSKKCRPHYHGIIHLDTWEMFDHVKKLIYETWLYCSKERIQVKQLDGQKFGYLSSYIAGQRNSNGVLSSHDFKEFQLFSKQPVYGIHPKEVEILSDLVHGRDNRVYREICGETPDNTTVLTLSKSILRSYFPRVRGVDGMDDSILLSIIRQCPKDSEDKYRLSLAARRFIRDFYGNVVNDSNIWLYIQFYRRIYSLLNAYLCRKLNEDVFKRVDYDSILRFYLLHYNSNQSSDNDLYSIQEYKRILDYIHQFDIHISKRFYFRFACDSANLLPLNYFESVNEYISKYKTMLLPKHTSHIINNF